MTDSDALLKASIRERRRVVLVFTILLVLVSGTLTAGWIGAWNGRESWHEQAMTWQDRYIELYDEFTTATGEEPDAPEPSDVPNEEPEAIPGAPGPVGPAGVAGKDGKRGAPGVPGKNGQDGESVEGPAGKDGSKGDPGESVQGPRGPEGPAGKDGATGPAGSTGPQGPTGPTGATGPAGATCPTGFDMSTVWVDVRLTENERPTRVQATVCLPIEGETP